MRIRASNLPGTWHWAPAPSLFWASPPLWLILHPHTALGATTGHAPTWPGTTVVADAIGKTNQEPGETCSAAELGV